MIELELKKNGRKEGSYSGGNISTIGRNEVNDIFLPGNHKISRFHAAIIKNEVGKYFVRDLGSIQGLMVNGERCYRKVLNPKDVISICDYEIKVIEIKEAKANLIRKIKIKKKDNSGSIGQKHSLVSSWTPTEFHSDDFGSADMPDAFESVYSTRTTLLAIPDFISLMKQLLQMLCDTVMKAEWGWIALQNENEELDLVHEVKTPVNRSLELLEYIYLAVIKKKQICIAKTPEGGHIVCIPLLDEKDIIGLIYLYNPSVEFRTEDMQEALTWLITNEELKNHISTCFKKSGNTFPKGIQESFSWEEKFIGNNRTSVMQPIYESIEKLGRNKLPILLLGETGTGKSVLAQKLHKMSNRRGNFVRVDLNAVSQTIESNLFGTERKKFTDVEESKGYIENARGGTFFLDEIANLSLEIQEKLLLPLDDNPVIRKIGGNEMIPVDIRVIAATNRDINVLVKEGKFKSDLYRRLGRGSSTITLPALRERQEDIALLANFFVDELSAPHNKNGACVEGISRDAIEMLKNYDWPGNIGELQQIIEQALSKANLEGRRVLSISDFPDNIMKKIHTKKDKNSDRLPGLGFELKNIEIEHIKKVYEMEGGNKTKTAKKLGISRPTLVKKLKDHGIENDDSTKF